MPDVNPLALSLVAEKLDRLGFNYAFVGGSIVNFLLDSPDLAPVRPTDDVDIILEVMASVRYSDIEEKLRGVGFSHDIRTNAPLCRWTIGNLTVDIMPTQCANIGLNTQWFQEALDSAIVRQVGHFQLKIISPVAFLATKLAAFYDRGENDYYASHDLEDLITVIDGRVNIVNEINATSQPLKGYILSSVRQLVGESAFNEALPAHLPPDTANQRRLPVLRQKLKAIANLGT